MKGILTIEQVKELKTAHKKCQIRKTADRIKSILMLNDGYAYQQISKILLLDDSTIRNYEKTYFTSGLNSLLETNYKGGTTLLTKEQETELDSHLQKHIYSNSKEIIDYIKKTYTITYSFAGIKALLYRLNYVYKKTKKVPPSPSVEAQKAFIEKYNELKTNKKPEDQIYFVDACHPTHNVVESFGWIKKGTEKLLPANTGRKRLNLNGAYNIETQEIIIREDKTIDAESTIKLFYKIMKEQPLGLINLVIDNAPYYRTKIIELLFKNHPRIKLIFLPTYSPNLNLIERLWLFYKQKILWNKYYEKYSEFKQESINFFENLHLHKPVLKQFITDNFHIINPISFSKS